MTVAREEGWEVRDGMRASVWLLDCAREGWDGTPLRACLCERACVCCECVHVCARDRACLREQSSEKLGVQPREGEKESEARGGGKKGEWYKASGATGEGEERR